MINNRGVKAYTGVGSRNTPSRFCDIISEVAYKLASEGYTLRSGAAKGADEAFEDGVKKWFKENGDSYPAGGDLAQVYIPWSGFVDVGNDYKDWYKVLDRMPNKNQAMKVASEVHPAWERCSRGAKLLHSRNVYQVLGQALNAPSKFLICWAEVDKQGKPKGGTRTAWVLGEQYIGIDNCFNLQIEEHRKRIGEWLK